MSNKPTAWVRVLVAASVIWALVAAGAVFAEYLSRNPLDRFSTDLFLTSGSAAEFYFWQWSGVDLLAAPGTQVRTFEPNVLRIVFFLLSPLLLIWVVGCLVVWVKDVFKPQVQRSMVEPGGASDAEMAPFNFDTGAEPQKLAFSRKLPVLPSSAALAVPATALGIKWLQFWTYFSLPVGGISFGLLCFAVPDWKWPFAFLAWLHFYMAYGLHRRFLWAWKGNWALVVVSWVGAAVPSDFGSPIDFAFKYAFVFLLGGVVWMWPNYVYWMKRKGLFHEGNAVAR